MIRVDNESSSFIVILSSIILGKMMLGLRSSDRQ